MRRNIYLFLEKMLLRKKEVLGSRIVFFKNYLEKKFKSNLELGKLW